MDKRLYQEHVFLNGFYGFLKERVKLSLKANLNIRQHKSSIKTSKRWELWCEMIVLLSEWLQKKLLSVETVLLVLTEYLEMKKDCVRMVPKNSTNKKCSRGGKFLLIFCNKLRKMTKSWTQSSKGTKARSFSMTMRQRGWECNGNLQAHSIPVKCRFQYHKKWKYWFVSYITKEQSPNSLSHLVKLSTRSFISKFQKVWDSRFVIWKQALPQQVDPAPWQCSLTTVLSVTEFLSRKSIMVLEHPAYLSNLAPCDFFTFSSMGNHLKGSHFESVEEIQKVMMAILNNPQKNDFWKCFHSWKQSCNSCTAAEGNYSDEDHSLQNRI